MNLPTSLPRLRRRFLRQAFTMVEIMLAMGIFSMVLISIYSSWSSIMRGTAAAQHAAATVQRCRVAVRAIEDAIQNAQIYTGNSDKYLFDANTSGEYASLTLTTRLPITFPGSGLYPEPQRLRYVQFLVIADAESRNSLWLRQWPLLTPGTAEQAMRDSYCIELGYDVDLFKLEFFDVTKKDWVDEWKQTNAFPGLVRISIGMGNKPGTPEDKKAIITRVIAPSTIVVPVDSQMPGGGRLQQPPGMTNMPGFNPNDPRMMPGGFNRGFR